MFDNKPKLFACESNGRNLENDIVDLMKVLQKELEYRGYKAVILGVVKDTKSIDEISDIFK